MKRSLFYIIVFLIIINTLSAQHVRNDTVSYMPGDHELFLMPTAYTMEEGRGYFSDYELLFLNFTFGVTSRTHLGGFFLFPITKDFIETFTLGAKQNYFRSEYFQGALWGSYTIKNKLYSVGNVFSFGKKERSVHLGISLMGEAEKDNNSLVFLLGGRLDVSRKVSLILEYTNAKELIDEDFNGLISIGIRFRGESTAWELAGIRPLESTGDFLFFPFLKATFYF